MSNCGGCCNLANISYPSDNNWLICNYRAYRICQEYYLNEKKGKNYSKFLSKQCDNNCPSVNNTFNSYEDYLHFKKAKDGN